jgi:hypothetical protein
MTTSESIQALRSANPRALPGFAETVEAAASSVHAQIETVPPIRVRHRDVARRRAVDVSTACAVAAAAIALALFAVGPPGGGPAVEDASAAFEKAATLTAASAERSGTAAVRITHDGELWAATTVRWNGSDIAIAREVPTRNGKAGDELRVVDGAMYGPDVDGGWVELGPPSSIDPDSGTTPTETLAAVREDVGGVTLRRITNGMRGLTTGELADGSTVYRGTVASGLIARETGFKEGEAIRVLPFGYVAHDQAANANAPLDVAVTVGADGIVRELAVSWGTWRYVVAYSGLGTTPAPVAPADARSLFEERMAGRSPGN